MKNRNGFVSNSSSSSFVVFGTPEQNSAWEYAVNKYCTLITNNEYKDRIFKTLIENDEEYRKQVEKNALYAMEYYDNKNNLISNIDKPMYLSTFISDTKNDDYQMFDYNRNTYEYYEGAHGGPYNENNFLLLDKDKNIWIKKSIEEMLNDELNTIISDSEIYEWSSLQNAKLVGHTLSDEKLERLADLSEKMEYSIIELYRLENNNFPMIEDVEYLMNNGEFVLNLCIKMIPRFQQLREKIKNEYSRKN